MEAYQKMYMLLFNAVTDAIEEIVKQNFGNAAALLKEAQWKCEEIYINSSEQGESN